MAQYNVYSNYNKDIKYKNSRDQMAVFSFVLCLTLLIVFLLFSIYTWLTDYGYILYDILIIMAGVTVLLSILTLIFASCSVMRTTTKRLKDMAITSIVFSIVNIFYPVVAVFFITLSKAKVF